MNIFGWYFEFSCMHVLKCKNKESFALVEFLASVSQVEFVARFPSNRRFFLRKSSHISRIVLRGNVTREFGHNYDGEERKLENKKKDNRFTKQSKNSEHVAHFLADSMARHHHTRPIQGIRIPKSRKFLLGIRNPGLWNPEYNLRNPECRQ